MFSDLRPTCDLGFYFVFPMTDPWDDRIFTYIFFNNSSHSCRDIYQSHGSYGLGDWCAAAIFFGGNSEEKTQKVV